MTMGPRHGNMMGGGRLAGSNFSKDMMNVNARGANRWSAAAEGTKCVNGVIYYVTQSTL